MLNSKSELGLLLRSRVTSNIIALALLQLVNYAGPFLILIYLTKVLDIEFYSFVALSTSTIQIAVTVLDFGFGLYAVKVISKNREDKEIVGLTIGSIFIIKLILFFLISIAFLVFIFFMNSIEHHRLIFFFSLLPVLGQAFQCDWFFLGVEKMKYITFISVSSRLISIVAIFLLIKGNEDYYLVPLSTGIAQIVAAGLFIFNIYQLGFYVSKPNIEEIRKTYNNSLPFFGSRVLVIAYTSAGIILMGAYSSQVLVSIYSVSEQIYKAFQTVFLPVTQAIYPLFVKEKRLSLFLKVSAFLFFVSIFFCIVGYLLSPFVIDLFFDKEFKAMISVLNIFYLAIPIHVLSVLFGYPLSAIFELESVANRSVIVGFIVYFSLVFYLISFNKMLPTNLAIVSLCTEIGVFSYRFFVFFPKVKVKLHDR